MPTHGYSIPGCVEMPRIKTLIVEVPDPLGPMGAKGIGELPVLPVAPAVLNAVRNAVGVHIDEIPINQGTIKAALSKKK